MLRLAAIALALTVIGLVIVALLPQRERVLPGELIELSNANVTLYPQADPAAVWYFDAATVDYDPAVGETTLHRVDDARRVVDGETDFTLRTDEVTIDPEDNLRGQDMLVHLVEANWDLDMKAGEGRDVVIDQAQGKFEVPILDYTGDGLGQNHAENVRMNFDLTDYEADCEGVSCQNQFQDNEAQ